MAAKRRNRKIDGYKIIKVLGRGGMGVVYLCEDERLGRQCAIKVLSRSAGKDKSTSRKIRFLREAMTTSQLQHPGIPPVYDVSETDDGRIYYSMKPIDGKSLQEILNLLKERDEKTTESYDLFRMIEIIRDVAQTLHYAHNKGYIHRDLKPSNIFVGDYGEVYVIDWGLTKALKKGKSPSESNRKKAKSKASEKLAKAIEANDTVSTDTDASVTVNMEKEVSPDKISTDFDAYSTLTMSGDIVGTLAYMPPEQASGEIDELSRQTDIYALGVILYEILTLELPVTAPTLEELVDQKKQGNVIPPEKKSPSKNIPPELSAITMQAMSPDPEERFKTTYEFEKALVFWLEGKPQMRMAHRTKLNINDFDSFPRRNAKKWEIEGDSIKVDMSKNEKDSYLFFKREFTGDVRFTANFIAYPIENNSNNIGEFSFIINGTLPDNWNNVFEGYAANFGAANNSKASLTRNDAEIAAAENLSLLPRQRYRITIECTNQKLKVLLNRQVVLLYTAQSLLQGTRLGIKVNGANLELGNVRVNTRGMPKMTEAINIPEALMEEECYSGALKRFLAIANAHRERYEGAWARYRAGIAKYMLTQKKQDAYNIWTPLFKGHFAILGKLGKAVIEIENNRLTEAAKIIQKALDSSDNIPHLDPMADIVFSQAQQFLRLPVKSDKAWTRMDTWVRLALELGKRVETVKAMTPSILWQWLLISIKHYPKHLKECGEFVRKTFGKGQGQFAEIATTIQPLLNLLRRSAQMDDNNYLQEKIMRLILSHDTHLGNLETLARFYLHSGHEEVAEQISIHICWLCDQKEYEIPPMPIAYLGLMEWLRGEFDKAYKRFNVMLKYSRDWAQADALLFIGLEKYRKGKLNKAKEFWNKAITDSNAKSYNRQLIAKGLLGQLPADPVKANVPNRSDHRLFYCLMLGYRHYLDWKSSGNEKAKQTAIMLLEKASELRQPSYDVYSSTNTIIRIPLELMKHDNLPEKSSPEELSHEEIVWLAELTKAASEEDEELTRSSTSQPLTRRKTSKKVKKNRNKK